MIRLQDNELNSFMAGSPDNTTIVGLFAEQVKKKPHNIAVVFEDKSLTYLELDVLSNQLANYTFAYNPVNGDSSITSIN